jgi:maltose operon protein
MAYEFKAIWVAVVFFPIGLLAAGCAPSYDAAAKELVAAKSCCRDLTEFKYEELPQDEPLVFELNQSSPAFNFPSGKSFFKALRLPERSLPYTIKIRSYAQGNSNLDSYIFYPKILLLNDSFALEKKILPDLVLERNARAAMKENFGGPDLLFSGVIRISEPQQRYLIVITTDALLASSSRWFLSLGVLAYSPLTPTEGFREVPHSPVGKVALELETVHN